MLLIIFLSLCMGHKRNLKEINECSYRLYRYQHVEVESSLRGYVVSDAESSGITFLLSLSAYSELTEIKTFTRHKSWANFRLQPWCKSVLVWYPLARLHGLRPKYFQHCDLTNCPRTCIQNVLNREFFEPLHPLYMCVLYILLWLYRTMVNYYCFICSV